jgi:hypothetical protein
METAIKLFVRAISGALMLATIMPAFAQDGPPANIAEMWTMHVNPAQQSAFEEAFKAHVALRKENEDPFHWEVFTPNTGSDLSTYHVRTCCFGWPGRDAYDAWEADHPQIMEHWNSDLHAHVNSYEHDFEEFDFANSHWPQEGPEPMFVGVTEYEIKPGMYPVVNAAKAELSQLGINEGWASDSRTWAWSSAVNGATRISLVIPFENYTDMVEPDPTYFEFLVEQLGEERAMKLFEKFNSGVASISYHIYTHRPDLSTPD